MSTRPSTATDGADLAGLPLESLAWLDAVVIRRPYGAGLATDADAFEGIDVAGRAVLVHTGWDANWRTQVYLADHPYLTQVAAERLRDGGAALVGIDSHTIEDTRERTRPVHSVLLGAGIPIREHMTNLGALPDRGARFTATPPKIVGMGTFAVRAFADVG